MSGSIDYSVLFGTSSSSDLFATIYGYGTTSTPASTTDPITALKLAQANQTTDIANEAKDPTVSRDVAAFIKGISQAKTLTDALTNPNVQQVLLTANGLSSLIGQTALVTKALTSNPADPNSLINKLGNTSLLNLAKSFNFYTKGLSALQSSSVQSSVANGYAEVKWRQSLDKTTPGLSYALDFRSRASSFTSADSILGDPTGWEVVLTALGIPQQIAFQDTPAQEQVINSRLDVKKLQDPKFVDTLVDTYLLNKQSAAQPQTQSTGLII
jgi:hypothetical protein